jgi:hypothetical protein
MFNHGKSCDQSKQRATISQIRVRKGIDLDGFNLEVADVVQGMCKYEEISKEFLWISVLLSAPESAR